MKFWPIAKREIYSFFLSPMAYAVLTVWLLTMGFVYFMFAQYFANNLSFGGSDTPLSMFFGQTILSFVPQLVFVPLMTMRLVAGENQSGTIESLMTAPVTSTDIVLGKFIAALVFWFTLWVPTLMYVWITSRFGDIDYGTVLSSYIGVLGIGTFYMAWGLLASTIARRQIVAAVITFLFLGGFFLAGLGEYVFEDYRELFSYLSVWSHMADFSKGVVDSRYLAFYASMTALALFLAVRVLDTRKEIA